MMNSRGQFYLFTVVVLASMLVFLLPHRAAESGGTSEYVAAIYRSESARAINSAILSGIDTGAVATDFNSRFTEAYKKNRVSAAYAVGYGGVYQLINELGEEITLADGVVLDDGSTAELQGDITFTLSGTEYTFHSSSQDFGYHALLVFTGENGAREVFLC